jgi:hypothetical protein
MKFFPVQNAFPRQEMRCSSSGLSTGDRAPTHQITPESVSCPQVSLPGSLRPFRAVMQHLATRSSTLRHLRLPSPRVASQREVSFRSAGRMNSGRDFERLSSEGQAPVHRVLHRPAGRMRMEERASLGRAACRLLQRDNRAYEHIHETASASASRPRACCQARNPQAFVQRSPTAFQVSLVPMNVPCTTRRESTTKSGFAKGR